MRLHDAAARLTDIVIQRSDVDVQQSAFGFLP
jgi:hypothetical protein